ncbi:GNAT family N-acetyltransferase [Roseibium sp.]|uniref:GNAT family N-acetyltransferase n=1 Tax=Roseibium sp. TaxID=1936156 RepID=UPI00262A2032|nr:GNAT family N-acetyltransferase [Roseibium sp.]
MPFVEADFPLILDLHSDREVNRYLSPGPAPMAANEVRERLKTYIADHSLTGISKWKVETKEGLFVGRTGFSYLKDPDGYELGYSFRREVWGRGYATEIAKGLTRWYFERTEVDYLIAYALMEHKASLRVMQKAGFQHWQDREKHGCPCRFYRIFREEFERSQAIEIRKNR